MILLFIHLSCALAEETLPTMKNHWLRAAPPNASMMAAYGQLYNNSKQKQTLIGAYSPDFGMTEIHKTVITEGMARMEHQPNLSLASNDQLNFKPGGLHIMLMHPKKPIKAGDSIKICLFYQQGDKQVVQHIMFPVLQK